MAAHDPQKKNDEFGFGCMTSILLLIVSIIAFVKGLTVMGLVLIIPTMIFNLLSLIKYTKASHRKKDELIEQLSALKPKSSGFNETQSFAAHDLLTKISVDEKAKLICIWAPKEPRVTAAIPGMAFQAFEYDYDEILAVELSQDGVSLGTKSSQRKAAQTLLEGLFSGDNGSIIGGSPSPKVSNRYVNLIELKIIVNDISRPLHVINFFKYVAEEGHVKLKKSSTQYQDHLNKVRHWYILLGFIIEAAEETGEEKDKLIVHVLQEDTHGLSMDSLSSMDDLLEQSKRRQLGQ